jgi:hypothetical protein
MRLAIAVPFVILLASCSRQREVSLDVAADETKLESAQASEQGFSFGEDSGGKLLAELLPPADRQEALPSDLPARPLVFPSPSPMEGIEIALPASEAVLPRPEVDCGAPPLRPRGLAEEVPLLDYRGDPQLPERPEFPVGQRMREWSPDANEPAALPVLARKERELLLSDAAVNRASLAAALRVVPLGRTTPVPVVPQTPPGPQKKREVRPRGEQESPVPTTSGLRPTHP